MSNFDTYLEHSLDHLEDSSVKEAMLYTLLGKGKRVRPHLMFAALASYGIEESLAYPCAAALEMIHNYSLAHDDLPAMDDDDLRRGRATTHIKFDEATAILAGDGLLTEAFHQLTLLDVEASHVVELVKLFSLKSGASGMVYGQILDLEGETMLDLDELYLQRIHLHKTSDLIQIALKSACILADAYSDAPVWENIARCIGLGFQVQDDVLDVASTTEELGKPVHSDEGNHKCSYVNLLGEEEATKYAASLFQEARNLVATLEIKKRPMIDMIEEIEQRRK